MYAGGMFYLNSLLLGVGLAVDGFIIALSNGISGIKVSRAFLAAATFAVFQFVAVTMGWAVAYTAYAYYDPIKKIFSYVAAAIFLYMSAKMFLSAAKNNVEHYQTLGIKALIIQSAAASVDALTVGFTIEEYGCLSAVICAGVIGFVTFALYAAGHFLGSRFGVKIGRWASVLGGVAFIAIAVEIIVTIYI